MLQKKAPQIISTFHFRFPFDTQECNIEFISVLHGNLGFTQKIKFILSQSTVNLHLYSENPGWDLIKTEVLQQLLLTILHQSCKLMFSLTHSQKS